MAAGWLSDGLLANPLVSAVPRRSQGATAVVAALVAASLGALLSRLSSSRGALGEKPLTLRTLALLVVLAGLVTGAVVGGLEAGTGWGLLSGAGNGGISALAFVPVCAVVVAAARRSERARRGSIVAAADRRAVWGILATALALTTLAAALDVPPSHYHTMILFPRGGVVMAVMAGLVVTFVLVADLYARVRVGRLGRAGLEQRDEAESRDADQVPSIDLGLGDDVRARMGRAASAYRGRARPVALVLGSLAGARSALGAAILRGVAGLAVVGAVLAGHGWAETRAALVEYQALLCESSTAACHDAGVLLLPETPSSPECPAPPLSWTPALSPDVPRAEALLRRGCDRGNRCSCDGLRASAEGRGAEARLPYWYTRR
jgi:hypothetical protein